LAPQSDTQKRPRERARRVERRPASIRKPNRNNFEKAADPAAAYRRSGRTADAPINAAEILSKTRDSVKNKSATRPLALAMISRYHKASSGSSAMRFGVVLLVAFTAILAAAQPVMAASPPDAKGAAAQTRAANEKETWDFVRSRINEDGFYPVPEFLRAAAARPPAGSPHILGQRTATGVDYPAARQMLIRQGFLPMKIVSRDVDAEDKNDLTCGEGQFRCRAYPELLECTAGGFEYCAFLYENARTGKYWIVSTAGEEGGPPDVNFKRWRCCGYRPAAKSYLYDLVIVRPDGRRIRFPHSPKP
jgi:hypothetical protein